VILSGGDPLAVPDRHLQWMIGQIAGDPAAPPAAPAQPPAGADSGSASRRAAAAARPTARLPVSLVIHANHAQELDDSVAAALALAPRRRHAAQPVGAAGRRQ
jgi:hypothetical protein